MIRRKHGDESSLRKRTQPECDRTCESGLLGAWQWMEKTAVGFGRSTRDERCSPASRILYTTDCWPERLRASVDVVSGLLWTVRSKDGRSFAESHDDRLCDFV